MSSSNDTIDQLNRAYIPVTFVFGLLSLVPGSIGVVLNIIIFTRPVLLQQPCSRYFLASSCYSFLLLFVILPLRLVVSSTNFDPANLNQFNCKMEFYLWNSLRAQPNWMIMLACIDRYIISSTRDHRRRRFSSPKTANLAILLTSLIVFLTYSHIFVFFNISPTNNVCSSQTGLYRSVFYISNAFVSGLCPALFMLICGILTRYNIQRQRRRVGLMIIRNQSLQQQTDSQLTRMLTAQVLVILLTATPSPTFLCYQSLTLTYVKSTLLLAQERLIGQALSQLTYMSSASSFYLYTLKGIVFRKELVSVISRCVRLFSWQHQRHTFAATRNERHTIPVKNIVSKVASSADQLKVKRTATRDIPSDQPYTLQANTTLKGQDYPVK